MYPLEIKKHFHRISSSRLHPHIPSTLRLNSLDSSSSQTGQNHMHRSLGVKLTTYILELNFFPSNPPSTDEHHLQNQRISTRLFIIVLTTSLVILLIYNATLVTTHTYTMKTPTLQQYEQLLSKYSQTIVCPCKNISISYMKFLHINYTLHQVCSSMFTDEEWIEYLVTNYVGQDLYSNDFRINAFSAFRALQHLCETVNATIVNNLEQFYLNDYITPNVAYRILFESQVDTFVNQFRTLLTHNFFHSFNSTRSLIHSNTLFSALLTNYRYETPHYTIKPIPSARTYGRCSCSITPKCITLSSVWAHPNILLFLVDGFYFGCFVVEALLQSNLQCFYNSTCVLQLVSYFTYAPQFNFTALDTSLLNQHSVNSTIQQILENLMIETWDVAKRYENYYSECQPIECTYSYQGRYGIVYIITVLSGLVGGLITVLKFAVPIVVKLIRRKRQRPIVNNGKHDLFS